MKTKSIVTLLCALSLLINACTPSGIPVVDRPAALSDYWVETFITYPLNGTIETLGREIQLYGSALTHDGETVTSFTFLANGVEVGTGEESSSSPTNYEALWNPPAVGEYYIQSEVRVSNGSVAVSEPHRICVLPNTPDGSTEYGGYFGPCQISTQTSGPLPDVYLTVNAVAGPNPIVSSDPIDQNSPACAPDPTLAFTASVADPQDLVEFVLAVVDYSNSSRGDYYREGTWLNWTTTRPGNEKEYRGTLQFRFPGALATVDSVTWYIRVYRRDGEFTGASRDSVIQVQHLECSQGRLEIATPTFTPEALEFVTLPPVVPPTFTLRMNSFCRKGPDASFSDVTAFTAGETGDILNVSEDGFWYFVDWKKFDTKCWVAIRTGDASGDLTGLRILIVPTVSVPEPPTESEPALPPASGCSSYGDASSCTTNGCSWDKSTSSCH